MEQELATQGVKGYEIVGKKKMKKVFVTLKETCQYAGIIILALFSGLFLVIKMAITDAKEETRDIERASKR